MNRQGKTSILEVLFILAMFSATIVMGIFKMWPLFIVFMTFDIIFGITEIVYQKTTGKTVSQHFWAYSEKYRTKAKIILVSMAAMWSALLVHLGYKMFRKKK